MPVLCAGGDLESHGETKRSVYFLSKAHASLQAGAVSLGEGEEYGRLRREGRQAGMVLVFKRSTTFLYKYMPLRTTIPGTSEGGVASYSSSQTWS